MNARPRGTQIPIGPLLAAIGGVLLIVSLGLDWYGGLSGFNSFEFLDLLLVVLALVTLAVLAAEFGLLRTQLREGTALVVGVVALVVVLEPAGEPSAGGLPGRCRDRPVAWAGRRRADARGSHPFDGSDRDRRGAAAPRRPAAAAPSPAPADQAPTVADEPRP